MNALLDQSLQRRMRPGRTFTEILSLLGNIPGDRVRAEPAPGRATDDDAVWINWNEAACELIDGTIVEKPVGSKNGFFAFRLSCILSAYVDPLQLGAVGAERILFRMVGGNLREADASYTRLDRMVKPYDAIAEWCPDLCIEVLSGSNTREEMRKKRIEYFASGCKLVWEFDPKLEIVYVYDAVEPGRRLTIDDTLDGGDVLPGFTLSLRKLFGDFQAIHG